MSEDVNGKAKGGFARAEVLAPDRRREIARKAAGARWNSGGDDLPKATHAGVLRFGETEIPCYVLANGDRVLSTRGIMKSLKRTWRGRKYSGTELPVFLEARNLKPFITNDLTPVLSPVQFRTPTGGKGEGYKAQILPAVCDIYLRAREAGEVLTAPQMVIAAQCEILTRALANLGIIGLVDEATGYQEVRDKHALQAILDAYLRQELAAWAKRFPDEFYQQIFRLRGWQWKGRQVNPPQVVAAYTKDIVYARLAPGILAELERLNPIENGRRKHKFTQWLTNDVGHPALAQHLHAVITLMRVSSTWNHFKQMLDVAHPKRGDTLSLPLMSEPSANASSPGEPVLPF